MMISSITIGIIWLALCVLVADQVATRRYHNRIIKNRITELRR
jgi:hypothetical protein